MRLVYIFFACAIMTTFGCNNQTTTTTTTTTTDSTSRLTKVSAIPPQSKLGNAGTQMLIAVINKYYTLKNALVATKGDSANTTALQLSSATDSLEVFLQKDSTNAATLKPYMDTVISQSMMASSIKDETCERQRLLFGAISSAMFGLLKNADLRHSGAYREYCPMAFNEKGAYWLSDDPEIKNPYFGKKMMECGEVTDTL